MLGGARAVAREIGKQMGAPTSRLLQLFVLLVLSACASRPAVSEAQLAGMRSIAVVSALGDTVSLQEFGSGTKSSGQQLLTAYGLASGGGVQKASIESWALDQFVVDLASQMIGACYDVRGVSDAAVAAKLAGITARGFGPGVDFFGDPIPEKIAQSLGAEMSSPPDAYVVVLKASEYFGRASALPTIGVGLMHTIGLLSHSDHVFALYRIYLVDGDQHRLLTSAIAAIPGQPPSSFDGPSRRVDASWWADSFEAMTEAQRQQLRQAMQDLIAGSLRNTLARVGLRCSAPRPGSRMGGSTIG
jgi:hypothetical protein